MKWFFVSRIPHDDPLCGDGYAAHRELDGSIQVPLLGDRVQALPQSVQHDRRCRRRRALACDWCVPAPLPSVTSLLRVLMRLSRTVNYAASVVLEVRQPSSGSSPVVRFTFKNGTDDATYRAYPMRFPGWDGSSGADVPLATFVQAFAPAGINTTLQWCNACGQTQARGCAALYAGNGTAGGVAVAAHHERISPVGAGILGAGLTVPLLGIIAAVLGFLGLLTLGRGKGTVGEEEREESHSSVRAIFLFF